MRAPRTYLNPRTPGTEQMFVEQVAKVLSGNVSFGATTSNADSDMNMDCHKATGTGAAANVEFSVNHNLKRVPIGFIVISISQATTIFKSTTAWTAATNSAQGQIFLKETTGATNFTIIII